MTNDVTDIIGGNQSLIDKVVTVIYHFTTVIWGERTVYPALPWSVINLAKWIINASEKYRVELGLMLAQAVVECHFGVNPLAKRSRRTKNIYNVGNVDSGADESQKTWEAGINRYAKLMHNEYLWKDEGDVVTMAMMYLHDFTRPRGGRYATASDYTKQVFYTYKKILKML